MCIRDRFVRMRKENMWVGSCIHIVCWLFLYSGSFATAIWIFCVCPCIGLVLFHFSLTCYSFYYSCILYPSSALVFFPHRRFPASLVSILFSPYLSFLSALLYCSKHLACFLHLLCWILVVFVHWIFIWHVSCTSCVGSYLYSYIGSSIALFL